MKYPHLWTRMYGAPLMLHADKAMVIESIFRAHVLGDSAPLQINAAAPAPTDVSPKKPYTTTPGGIAILPVFGTLMQRGSMFSALSGMSSYGRVGRMFDAALADNAVRGIMLEIDSPGGEASGVFDLAQRIFEARAIKPVWAAANEMAFSAAYAIAASAERIIVPRSADVGSVGVIALFVDQSKRDAQQGYSYTAIYAGARKNDFSPHAPLTEAAAQRMQAEVDRLYEMFVSQVATMRGISPDAVRATEAGTLNADAAVAAGFADAVMAYNDAVAEMERAVAPATTVFTGGRPAARQISTKENSMANEAAAAQPAGNETTEQPRDTQPALDAAKVAADARASERTRIAAILDHPEAQGRDKLARHLALSTDMEADAAGALLAASPKQAVAAALQNPLAAAMADVANPDIGADAGQQDESLTEAQAVLAAYRKVAAK